MEVLNITTWLEFKQTFALPIIMSLIGAIIGHYGKNGIIQMPIIVIKFESGSYFKDSKWFMKPIRWFYIFFDFLFFIIGFRFHKSQDKEGVWMDLGFLGDMLIGVGTGILAKCTLAVLNTPSDFVVITTSLLAGFAGLSYIQAKQDKYLVNKAQVIQKIDIIELDDTASGLKEVAAGEWPKETVTKG